MWHGRWIVRLLSVVALAATMPGCATMRRNAVTPDLRPCSDDYVYTSDGWRLGIRRIRPETLDPSRLPVVLCHGLGLNGTFWTITDNHLPAQLAAHGFDVFIFDFRGSGESSRVGWAGRINDRARQTFLREWGEANWTVDDLVRYDVPAVLDYVKQTTGHDRVNWVGHSLGGMLMFPYLELSPHPERIANFVGMGSTIIQAEVPQRDMLRANRGLRALGRLVSTGRMGRPLMYFRFPGLERIDQFYYTSSNVDKETIARFYGYTLEDPGPSALKQFDPYLQYGHFLSADRRIDYSTLLPRVTTPTLLIAGEGDSMSDMPSTELTFQAIGSRDKTLLRFGKRDGHVADYGHCDLVWSRHAPTEIFPPLIDWLERHQPGPPPSAQQPAVRPTGQGGVLLGPVSPPIDQR
jgi:pimeloyl-ACP methyl ester carboxylesterase